MELEPKINIKSDKFSPEATLKIGSTKISILKENSYMIESTGLLLDSINENITHSHEYSKEKKHDKHIKTSFTSMAPNKKTKKSLYDKIKMKFIKMSHRFYYINQGLQLEQFYFYAQCFEAFFIALNIETLCFREQKYFGCV